MRLNKILYTKPYTHLSTTLLVKFLSFVMLRIQMSTYVPLLLGSVRSKYRERGKESCPEENIRHKKVKLPHYRPEESRRFPGG
jgi:hypothetical protein